MTDPEIEALLRRLYAAFNARRIETVLAAMDPDVDWPNALEGTRVIGRNAVREYWLDQFGIVSSKVEPLEFKTLDDGRVQVRVSQVVHELNGDLAGQGEVLHIYRFEGGLVAHMEVRAVG